MEEPLKGGPTNEPSGPFPWNWRDLQLETETAFFILANVLDFILTYLLLWTKTHFEANPLARYFLDRWGITGMLYFKLGMVTVVCIIVQIVAQKNRGLARRVLLGLTLLVSAVVVYSMFQLRKVL